MGIFSLSSRAGGKNLLAKVSTMDADLEKIAIEPDWTGRQLYDTVCRIIGLREIWYFGLQFVNKKGIPCWLQMEKKVGFFAFVSSLDVASQVCKQEVPKQVDGSVHFLFLVKFYPEDVEEELIQDITRHLFFLQIKQSILSMQLYCSAEASQGDCSEDSHLVLGELLPECVIKQYDMSAQMWEERIRRWWANNAGQSREDAEMEYLRVAQDLEMYGIQYYPICNSKETDLNLGVSAQGIGIYKESNRITPRPFFSWSEIKNISFKNKLFTMRTMDKSTITFRAKDMSINMSILDLCIGTHNLYLRRRQPDLLEVQQMKAQAKEQRIRRMQEQNRLAREREQRIQAETDRDRYKNEFNAANEELCNLKEAMKKTEETAQLLAEKARVSEEEALVLSKRASEAEAECQRMKISQIKATHHHVISSSSSGDGGYMAQQNEESTMSNPLHPHVKVQRSPMFRSEAYLNGPPPDPSTNQFISSDLTALRSEIEKSSWYSAYALPCSQQYPAHHHVISSSSSGDGGYMAQQNEESTMSNPLHPHVKVQRSPMFRSEAYLNGPPPDPSTNQFISSDLTALRSEIEKSR
uniref:Moesin/ezrin/radixin homolog 1 n=1 Tax=Ascaris lumbricoides TaxID=6252 RepID=A0A0M3ILH4_ASCLU